MQPYKSMVVVARPWSSQEARWQEETIMYTKQNQLGPNWNKIWQTIGIRSGYFLFIVNINNISESIDTLNK